MAELWTYAWLIPALPALAAALIALFGMKMGNRMERGGWLAVVLVGAAAALSLGVFFELWGSVTFEAPKIAQIEWFSTGTGSNALTVNMGVYVDPLTIFMLFTVGILVTLITLYSTGYMHDEGHGRRRYYAELTLFITGMLGLVVASNYLMLFIFWEVMGLCSYLLIGYWYQKPSAASAAKKAFLTTRVGDAFFLVGLGILLMQFKTLDFDELFRLASEDGVDRGALLLANSCIFIGAVGKSAQFPLHTWLPDAMEGPTTVSALIHAATMVKAGVYLVARSFPLFTLTPELLVAVAVIGGFTALFAATMALTNWDLKRVLAYSTLSQLGYMFLGLGVAGALYYAHGDHAAALAAVAVTGVTIAIFHLFSHAFFKAGLFLSAGSVGHAFHGAANPYDMRQMGGLRRYMPITAFAMLMGTISIAGIPPFSGFFSKDGIIHAVYEAAIDGAGLVYWALFAMAVATAGLTAYYMFRLYFLTFEGRHRGLSWWNERSGGAAMASHEAHPMEDAHAHDHGHAHAGPAAPPALAHAHAPAHAHEGHHDAKPHEGPWTMTLPLAILGLFAIFGGILGLYFAHGDFSGMIRASDDVRASVGAGAEPAHGGLVDAIVHPFLAITTYITLAVVLVGIGLAWIWWGPSKVESSITTDAQVSGLAKVWQKRYYIDDLYDRVFGYAVLRQADAQDRFDAEVIDGAVNGVATANERLGERTRKWNTGLVQDYALTMLCGFVLLVLLVIYWRQIPIMIERFGGA